MEVGRERVVKLLVRAIQTVLHGLTRLDCGTEIALPMALMSLENAEDNWDSFRISHAAVRNASFSRGL